MTGIEPALSAWEAVPSGPVTWPDLRGGVSASDRERPLFTGVNGPLMARRSSPNQPERILSWFSTAYNEPMVRLGRRTLSTLVAAIVESHLTGQR